MFSSLLDTQALLSTCYSVRPSSRKYRTAPHSHVSSPPPTKPANTKQTTVHKMQCWRQPQRKEVCEYTHLTWGQCYWWYIYHLRGVRQCVCACLLLLCVCACMFSFLFDSKTINTKPWWFCWKSVHVLCDECSGLNLAYTLMKHFTTKMCSLSQTEVKKKKKKSTLHVNWKQTRFKKTCTFCQMRSHCITLSIIELVEKKIVIGAVYLHISLSVKSTREYS